MIYILIRTAAVLIASYITKVGVPIVLAWSTGLTALLVAIVLAVVNHTLKPVLHIVSLPITILTLGLFSFVINGLMVLLASSIVPGFHIPSLLMAIWFSIVLSIINWVLHVFE
ncbi:MAG: rane protein [Candidatus Nomurabacteria bacterium]|nr:rane protein [Candidatus Nomurabacteria bacterium]